MWQLWELALEYSRKVKSWENWLVSQFAAVKFVSKVSGHLSWDCFFVPHTFKMYEVQMYVLTMNRFIFSYFWKIRSVHWTKTKTKNIFKMKKISPIVNGVASSIIVIVLWIFVTMTCMYDFRADHMVLPSGATFLGKTVSPVLSIP